MDMLATEFFRHRTHGPAALVTSVIRVLVGLAYCYFGISKLGTLPATTEQFAAMGFGNSSAIPFLVALLETFGGILLVAGLLTRLAAAGLAIDMAGACVAITGIMGENRTYLLLPLALLLVLLFLLWAGPGGYALDEWLAGRLAGRFGVSAPEPDDPERTDPTLPKIHDGSRRHRR
ncbi:MAG TPA: DoxX family protein [Pseudonocardia sp.]|uniref:DoxX family protein n=1 Tax=Pseudonocardia sp. TaxID=60912 RepID=UPI002F3FDBF9